MCNHLGLYDTYLRVFGYSNVRVYHCHDCGAHMAMDTLPQQLYKRMYPMPGERPLAPIGDLLPVDFCISLGGLNTELLSRMCLWSLDATCATFNGVTFHLINRGIPDDVFDRICDMVPGCTRHVRPSIPDYLMNSARNRRHLVTGDLVGLDTLWTYRWMTENCGSNKHVMFSHFDIFFVGDFLNYLRGRITDKTGMLGQHCPFMVINREAFAQSHFGYLSEGPFYGVPIKTEPSQFHLYYKGDPRIPPGAMQTGFDNGELLELELRILGWDTDALRDKYDQHFYHFTGGDRVTAGVEFVYMQERARRFIEEWNIPENPRVDTNRGRR